MSEKQEQPLSEFQGQGYAPPTYTPGYSPYPPDKPTTPILTGQPVANQYTPALSPGLAPPDYLYLSIFSIICCFWPIGIIALIKSVETQNHVRAGRYLDAETSSREAKSYNKVAIIIGIIINVIAWIIAIISIVGSVVASVTIHNKY